MLNFIRGFCMALADSVPGVSGGTVAFLLGFYDRFISSLDDLITGNKQKKIEAVKFLLRIGVGWALALGQRFLCWPVFSVTEFMKSVPCF